MILKSDGKFLSVSHGVSQRGDYYEIALVIDSDTQKLRCSEDVYKKSNMYSFGDDINVSVNCRNYRGDWFLRVEDVEVI